MAVAAADKAYLYNVNGNYDAAIAEYTQAIDLADDIKLAEYYSRRGYVYIYLKQFQAAIDDFNQAKKFGVHQHHYHLNLAFVYLTAKKYDECLLHSNAALAIKDNDILALTNRACSYFYKHEYHHALKDFQFIIRLNPDDPLYYFNIAMVYCALNDEETALKFFSHAKLLGANSFNFYYQYGHTLLSLGRYQEAINNLKIALGKKQELMPLLKLANAYSSMGTHDIASKYLEKAIELYPNNPNVYTTRAYILYNQKKYAEAKGDLLHALSIKKTHGPAHLLLGVIFLLLNDIKEAENYLLLAAHEETKWNTQFFYKTYSEILLTRINNLHYPEASLQNIVTFLADKKNFTSETINATCILILGYYSAQKADEAVKYTMMLLQNGYPAHLTNFLRHDLFDFITHDKIACKKIISSVKNVLAVKENWLSCMIEIENQSLRQRMLWQALLPNTIVGCIFYIPRHGTLASLLKGKLLDILKLLNNENDLRIDDTFIACLTKLKTQSAKYNKFISELEKITMAKFPKLREILIKYKILAPNQTAYISEKNLKIAREETMNRFDFL